MPSDHPPDDRSNTLIIHRILDANFNRCREGLRVVEDFVRFGLEDRHLAGECKKLRHSLLQTLAEVPIQRLHAARDTAHDVGTDVSTPEEYQREDCHAVVSANWSRVNQAFRCLEEYLKVVSPQTAPVLESLRYRAYGLERAMSLLVGSLQRLASARLYVLIDGRSTHEDFVTLIQQVIEGGADILQLRDKVLADRVLIERARVMREMTRRRGVLFIMNDRPDLARLADADGVHVGQTELDVKDARSIVGTDALIGVSTHCLAQARQAVLDGADYLGCGPTFSSNTKPFSEFAGPRFLSEVSCEIRLPAFAIGGISPENVCRVLAQGGSRIAVRDAVVNAPDPCSATRALRQALDT